MADPYPLRPISENEFDSLGRVTTHAFHGPPASEGQRAASLSTFEMDRSLAAFDGGEPVSSASVFSFQMSVPGAVVPTAGVTWVAVLPSHRRRGILRSMMLRQLSDIRDRGEPIAALWASETPIYGRYGYGPATSQARFTFRRGEGALAPAAPRDPALRLRIAEPSTVLAELGNVYETVLDARPGLFRRNEAWWARAISDLPEARGGLSALHCLLAEDDDGPRGYALYASEVLFDRESFLHDTRVAIRELMAADPAASAQLWGDLLSRDLAAEFTALLRPADDPVLFQVADARRARPRQTDGIWVRVIDLPAALTARRYSCPVDVVLQVQDELLPGNAGRWRLHAPGPGSEASCERTTAPADVSLDVRELGAAYLGGTRLGSLACAGLVTELRPWTLRQLSAAMSWDPSPWCPMIF